MRLPSSFYNWTSVLGTAVAVIAFFMIAFFFAISVVFDQGGSYLGLLIYLVLPIFLILGLILIPIGMIIKIRRDRSKQFPDKMRWPQVDLNNRQHRNAFIIFTITTTIFLFVSSVGSYEAFHYTESVSFCGTLCHSVMEPEYTTYQNSAHARVACVDCHVGEGADWFVRSKISGVYQVYAVTANIYPRPIPTPIQNLRPARETCEKCHWPEKFYTQRFQYEQHYLADSANTPWHLQLLLKIGPKHEVQRLSEGIHWHINPSITIDYYTPNNKEEEIPWVRYTNHDTGNILIYKDTEWEMDSTIFMDENHHLMDCMDCHNRPSHGFLSPPKYIDHAMASGDIPASLPYIKMAAMEALKDTYSSSDSADFYIHNIVTDYYRENHPALFKQRAGEITKSIESIRKQYHNNSFPHMNVRWDIYPNHNNHMESLGCFRCHDNKHATPDGRVISKDCRMCHEITAQGTPPNMEFSHKVEGLTFKHPVDIGDDWKDYSCSDCHAYLYP